MLIQACPAEDIHRYQRPWCHTYFKLRNRLLRGETDQNLESFYVSHIFFPNKPQRVNLRERERMNKRERGHLNLAKSVRRFVCSVGAALTLQRYTNLITATCISALL